MKWAELVLRYVQALVWPSLALTAILVIRPHLSGFFKRMRVGEFNGFGVRVRAELDEVMQFVASRESSPKVPTNADEIRLREKFDLLIKDLEPPTRNVPFPGLDAHQAYVGLIKIVGECASLFGLESTPEETERIVDGEINGRRPVETRKLEDAGIIDRKLSATIISLLVLGHVLDNEFLDLKDGTIAGFKDEIDAGLAKGYNNAVIGTSKILIQKAIEEYLGGHKLSRYRVGQ